MENQLKATAMFKSGWETFKKNPVQHVLVVLIISAVSLAANLVMSLLIPVFGGLINSATFGILAGMLYVSYAILQDRNTKMSPTEIAESVFDFEMWWKYLFVSIMVFLATMIGLVLLLVPGIILSLGLVFAKYLVVDYKMSPIDAIKKSWEITDGYKWNLLILGFLTLLVNIAGFLALLVGLLITVPVTMFAWAHAYNILTGGLALDATQEQQEERPEEMAETHEEDKDEADDEADATMSDSMAESNG